jgi:hypothetical protein
VDIKAPIFVRWVDEAESLENLVNEAKARTWVAEAEHAILRLESDLRPMIMGGRDGIQFEVEDTNDGQIIRIDLDGLRFQVLQIVWHTHPRVTGPSDGDREAIILLKQSISRIYELGGDRDGTSFGPDKSKPDG